MHAAHNVANACIAYAVAERFGCTRAQAVAALADFAGADGAWRMAERNLKFERFRLNCQGVALRHDETNCCDMTIA